jgi:hypothetical protein
VSFDSEQILCNYLAAVHESTPAHYARIFASLTGKRTGATGWGESAFSASLMRRCSMLRSRLADSSSKPRCEFSSITSRAYRSSVARSGFSVVYITPLYSGPPRSIFIGPRKRLPAAFNLTGPCELIKVVLFCLSPAMEAGFLLVQSVWQARLWTVARARAKSDSSAVPMRTGLCFPDLHAPRFREMPASTRDVVERARP